MIIVVDVSAAIEIIFQREKVNRFKSIYNQGSWIIAPDLFIAEIDMIDDFIKTRELWKESLAEGIKNNHSIYDMYYAVLARRNDATLITNDGALARVCEKLSIEICS